jgi:C-terminal processing protease CtpA/Prc
MLKPRLQTISAHYLQLSTISLKIYSINSMQSMKNHFFVATLVGFAFLSSCKKNDLSAENLNPPTTTTPTTPTVTPADALKDSALLYTQDIYLWYNQIPSTFNARSYSDPDEIMTAIRQYSIEPGFGAAVDRWSFAVKQAEWDNVSSGVSTGDFGLNIFFKTEGDLRVRHVEKESPAGVAGVRRGWRITAINGDNNITTSNANFIVQNVYQSNTASITFQKPDNSSVTLNLNANIYREHPAILDSVYNINAKKIGYFAFNSFLGDTTEIYNDFSRVFNKFSSAGVNDVIVDLRYNGGGYVSVQEKLANWLAPSSANGQLMMKQQFNDKYTQYNSDDRFNKLGGLNLNRIFFIVSSSTASASELLINNLKPYMDVQLVGPSKTYGKPVGFFPIPVGDWYIFPVSFRTTNSNGEGSYFNGLAVNSQVADGLDKDWGNIEESSLKSALSFVTTGAFRSQAAGARGTNVSSYQEQPEVRRSNVILDQPSFKGTIDTRRMK